MCYHKSEVQKFIDLMDHYTASFHAIKDDLEMVKEQCTALLRKDGRLMELGLGKPKALNNRLIQCSRKDPLPRFYAGRSCLK